MAIASHAIANRVCDPRPGWQNVKNICGFDRFLQVGLDDFFRNAALWAVSNRPEGGVTGCSFNEIGLQFEEYQLTGNLKTVV
jgi:hypothetical protein